MPIADFSRAASLRRLRSAFVVRAMSGEVAPATQGFYLRHRMICVLSELVFWSTYTGFKISSNWYIKNSQSNWKYNLMKVGVYTNLLFRPLLA